MDDLDESTQIAKMAARRRTMDPITANALFNPSGPESSIRPTPRERIGNMESPSQSYGFSDAMSPIKPTQTHSRSKSYADPMIQAKRRSVNFPVHASALSFSPHPSPSLTPAPTPELVTPSPTRGGFLTELASQERRVMELKEELARAEQHLTTLKKKWATTEMTKKRDDVHQVQQLQPLDTSLANLSLSSVDDDDQDGHSAWLQREMERRKVLLNGPKSSQRRIFSGSRHTRTLSLLSPDKTSPSFPQPPNLTRAPQSAIGPRSSTSPDLRTSAGINHARQSVDGKLTDLGNALQREMVIRTGKQMATDFKDNLWTFIEDLRQATVGDDTAQRASENSSIGTSSVASAKMEAKESTPVRGLTRASTVHTTEPTRQTKHRPSDPALIDIGGSFWREHGITGNTPQSKRMSKKSGFPKSATPKKSCANEEDGWHWNTPAKAEENSSSDSEGFTGSSPRTSTSSTAPNLLGLGMPRTISPIAQTKLQSNSRGGSPDLSRTPTKSDQPLPWPNIVKELSPTNLKRTASHLMNEWEKSLLPPSSPGTRSSENQSREDAMAALEGRSLLQ